MPPTRPAPPPTPAARPARAGALLLLVAALIARPAGPSHADPPPALATSAAETTTTTTTAPAHPASDTESSAEGGDDEHAPGEAPAAAAASNAPARPRRPLAPAPHYPTGPGQPERLEVPNAPAAWFYRPASGGRQRVIMYLHGRNSDPHEHCRQLRDAVRPYGWLLCAVGPVDRGGGRREWRIDRETASHQVVRALDALVARFPRRVHRHDNIMMGFSEGALIGMNVALMNPRTFPRWLIVAPDDRYIAGNRERIARTAHIGARVYLLVGSEDVTLPHSRRAHAVLESALGPRRERFRIVPGMPHVLPPDHNLLRAIFAWLSRGSAPQ